MSEYNADELDQESQSPIFGEDGDLFFAQTLEDQSSRAEPAPLGQRVAWST